MEAVKNLQEDRRRELQAEAGLVIIRRRTAPPERNTTHMHTNQDPSPGQRPSRAQATLERLTEPPTFTEVAKHELKRAVVWVPMLLTTGISLLAINKRFFLPKVG